MTMNFSAPQTQLTPHRPKALCTLFTSVCLQTLRGPTAASSHSGLGLGV